MAWASDALVLDASIAVKWYLRDESDVATALRVYDSYRAGRLVLIAPTHIRYEIPSALSVGVLRGRIGAAEAQASLDLFLAVEMTLFHDNALLREAFAIYERFGSAFYDSLYVALAQRLALPFVTADRPLYERVRTLDGVTWIADWSPPV